MQVERVSIVDASIVNKRQYPLGKPGTHASVAPITCALGARASGAPNRPTTARAIPHRRFPPQRGLYITYKSRCVRPGCKYSPWRRLPVAQASSLRGGIPLYRRQALAMAAGAQARTWYNQTSTHRYRMHA